ncbi:hypothetical protein OIU78_012479 [Salix suchowensis]|nr:hypothetical protein OIU78_012479 [Salix suchowensis]
MGLRTPLTFFPLFFLDQNQSYYISPPKNSLCRINVSFSVQICFFLVCFIRIRSEEVSVDKEWPSFKGERESSS